MKAAIFRGIEQIEVTDVPKPEPYHGEQVIRTGTCGICGSDLETYHSGTYESGVIIGHKLAGTITEICPGVVTWGPDVIFICTGAPGPSAIPSRLSERLGRSSSSVCA